MATEFTFTKAANVVSLTTEIEADAGISTALDFIYVEGTDLHVHFVANLSAGEETALNAVVAAHTGTPTVQPGVEEPPLSGVELGDNAGIHDRQAIQGTSTLQTTSQTFVDLPGMTLTTKDMGEDGSYLITFAALVLHSDQKKQVFFRLLVDGVEVAVQQLTSNFQNLEVSFSFVHQESPTAAGKIVKMEWHNDNKGTASVTNRELVINGVPISSVVP